MSLFGFGVALVRRNLKVLTVLLLCFPAFLMVVLVSGCNFAYHTYYIIPYVPIMALLAGVGVKAVRPRSLLILILAAVCIEGIAARQNDFRIKSRNLALLHLESDLDSCSSRNALIAVNGSGSPTAIYFAHRKGWSLHNDEILNKSFVENLRQRGLQYIVIMNHVFGAAPITLELPVLIKKDAYTIYTLSGQSPSAPGTKNKQK
jgi:hypothetical protein